MTRSLRHRVNALAKEWSTDRIEELERRAGELHRRRRVEQWKASRADFEILTAPTIETARHELIDAAVRHRRDRLQSRLVDDEWRPDRLAAAVIDSAPDDPECHAAYATLERIAEPPSPDPEWYDQHFWRVDPWDSYWFKANCHLVALGPDHGASLHEAAEPALAAAEASWLEGREDLAELIRQGEAHRLHFMWWVEPDLDERRLQLVRHAVERRTARHEGAPLEVNDVRDLAAEIVSYLNDESLPEEYSNTLRAAREQRPIVGAPCHEEWVQANELHWVLGCDPRAKKLRAQLESMIMEDANTTIT